MKLHSTLLRCFLRNLSSKELYSYLFSAPAQYIKKNFYFRNWFQKHTAFFRSTEQERNYGGHKTLENFLPFMEKSVEHSVKLLYI